MDDIIGILVVIGIFLAVVGKSKKRAGQMRSNKPGQAPVASTAKKAVHAPVSEGDSGKSMEPEDMTPEDMAPQSMQIPVETRLSDATKALIARLDGEKEAEGKQIHLATGSMPRMETGMAPRTKAVKAQEAPFETVYRKEAVACACGARFTDAAHMREAVVMAEILDKPVSLRPRHRGR